MDDFQGMRPYQMIFPENRDGVFALTLRTKVGKVKPGKFHLIETYCVERNCDCRRTTIFVINDKSKTVAVIDFGFDPEGPLAGPFLNDFEKQSAGAADFLKVFVEVVNESPDWLKDMYRRYKQVRRKVDGHAYRGRPFPKPGQVRRVILPPEPLGQALADSFEELLQAADRTPPCPDAARAGKGRKSGRLAKVAATPSLADLVEQYRQVADSRRFEMHRELQGELARYLFEYEAAGDELAALLVRLAAHPKKNLASLEAALRLLFDGLEILRFQMESQRPGARARMVGLQEALARQVFAEGGAAELCAAVTSTLLQARVEILPQLHEAGSQRMLSQGGAELSQLDLSEDVALRGLFGALEEMGVDSPFELQDGLLEMMAVGDAEVQAAMAGEMLITDSPLLRDTAALMLFNPRAEVRAGVAHRLARVEGRHFTPATLRRLIVARNWFPEEIRAGIDQAISNARRARVECAPVPPGLTMSVYASVVDGAGAQSFQAIIPDGKGFVSCAVLLKTGVGVADAFMVPIKNKRALREFLEMLSDEAAMLESTPEHLDQRVCQALAEGARLNKVPSPWLVAIAERLGREQWRPTPLDPRRELAALRGILEISGSKFLSEKVVREALEGAATWHDFEPFAFSWFEDNAGVERDIAAAAGKKKIPQPAKAVAKLLGGVLEEHRELWLERLVLATLWLRAAKNPPVAWPEMFHVAAALADPKMPLKEIPLMLSVANATFGAYLARKEGGAWECD
jgi:hypothetical protein